MHERVEAALSHLRTYLQDEIPPQAAADALATLMAQPPDVVMQRVAAWCAEQHRPGADTVCDLLVFALKKIYIAGELQLLDREAVADYLDRVTTLALRICPAEERDKLRADLTTMRMSRATSAARVPIAIQPIPIVTPIVVPNPAAGEDALLAKRFSLVLDRVNRQMRTGGSTAAPDAQTVAQLVTMAASRAHSSQQLNAYLDQLRPLGGGEGNVFVILGGGMPSWDLPAIGTSAMRAPAQVEAMEKIIDLAEDSAAAFKRFRELVVAAVGKFNDGSLAAAVWMLDVAEDTINERKLDLEAVDRVRAGAADEISSVQLRKYAENRTRHAALKIALSFFPTLRLDLLFQQLRGEARAERRRTLLGFIEAYGAAGREAALAELGNELQRTDVDTYYLRNLIYLLHRIQRESYDTIDGELELLAQASARGENIYVVKEAATALGQIKSEAAVKLLTTRLAEFEALLLRGDPSLPAAEVQKLLDRLTGALLRIGTTAALLAVARHGMKANALLGDTRARLALLSQHDLSFDEETVNLLVKAIRDETPGKLLGRLGAKKPEQTVRLVEALSGTRSNVVEQLFGELARRFADQDFGRAAAAALEKWGASRPAAAAARSAEPAATLTGELEFFGLPSVMQSLADMRATGMLTLTTKDGQAASKLLFLDGRFLNAQTAQTRGIDALYEALERPVSGRFAFVPHPAERMKSSLEPIEIMGLLLEGLRRYDELQRYVVLVPDTLALATTNVKPTPCEGEKDAALVRDVWIKAASGAPVGSWERQIGTDAYRVRRLVAHWLEQGALVGAEAATA